MRRSRSATRSAAVTAVAVWVAIAGCTSGGAGSAGDGSVSSPSPGTPGPAYQVGLTGLPGGLGRPVLAVKIDNSRFAHPQLGVSAADLVYVEQVEGQTTRLLAIYSSTLPKVVGPVRSARENDVPLLGQFGRVPLAYSGANRGVLRILGKAALDDASAAAIPSAYFRDAGRRSPYNLLLRPGQAIGTGTAVGRDIGLRFDPAVPTGGAASRGFGLRFGPIASMRVGYSSASRTWQLTMDGSRVGGERPAAPVNVVVQYVEVRPSRFRDGAGYVTPYTVTVGTGDVVVFRDGRALPGRWRRADAASGTRFTTATGADLPLRPGPTWIVLARRGLPLTR